MCSDEFGRDRESDLGYGTCSTATGPYAEVDNVRMDLVSTTTSQQLAASQGRLPTRDRQIIGILLVATFVVILNETIMAVALPR